VFVNVLNECLVLCRIFVYTTTEKGKGGRITEDVYIIISVDGAPAGRARRHFWLQDAVSRDGKKPIASRGSRAKDKRNIITTAVRIHYA